MFVNDISEYKKILSLWSLNGALSFCPRPSAFRSASGFVSLFYAIRRALPSGYLQERYVAGSLCALKRRNLCGYGSRGAILVAASGWAVRPSLRSEGEAKVQAIVRVCHEGQEGGRAEVGVHGASEFRAAHRHAHAGLREQ